MCYVCLEISMFCIKFKMLNVDQQEAALRTFHISDDPKAYYITEATEKGKRLTITIIN